MSESSIKGKSLELKIAKTLRSKLGVKVARDKQSGAGINKSDISDYWREIPLFIEAKNHKTIKIKEFFKQAKAGASMGQIPTVVFNVDDEEVLACLPFDDLVNLLVEIQDYKKEVEMLRAPLTVHIDMTEPDRNGLTADFKKDVKLCRAGHMSDIYGYCMQIDCKFSRGYKASKKK